MLEQARSLMASRAAVRPDLEPLNLEILIHDRLLDPRSERVYGTRTGFEARWLGELDLSKKDRRVRCVGGYEREYLGSVAEKDFRDGLTLGKIAL